MKKKMICKMLGQASLIYEGQEVELKVSITSKLMQLLFMLLYAGEEGIAKVKLLKNLYGQEELQDVKNALRILVFRLKKFLIESGLPADDYIVTKKGICYFGGNLELEIDARIFIQAASAALTMEDGEAKIEEMKRVCKSYTGEFLPDIATETWVTIESLRQKDLFSRCTNEACELLGSRGRYEEMLELCRSAAEKYPLEEWQVMEIDCLIHMERYKEALQVYEKTATLYFDELGLPPSEKMMEQFRIMSGKIQHAADNLPSIQNGLNEGEKRRGAYYCSYPGFVDSYRMLVRMIERTGISIFLMLCTLTDNKGMPLGNDKMTEADMDNLCQALENSLRRGDSYTRYSQNQTLTLLIGINQENCDLVFKRVCQNFKKLSRGRRVDLACHKASVAEMGCLDSDLQEDIRKMNWN